MVGCVLGFGCRRGGVVGLGTRARARSVPSSAALADDAVSTSESWDDSVVGATGARLARGNAAPVASSRCAA